MAGEDGKVIISTEIDIEGIKKGTTTIQKELKKAEKGIEKSLGQSSKKAGKSVGNLTGKISDLTGLSPQVLGMAGPFAAVGLAVAGVTKAINECTDAYKIQEKAETQLEAAALNNPLVNGESVEALKQYASEIQSISTVGDEELLPFMAQLVTAGRSQDEIMKIMSASVDIAASGTMSLESAVRNLNKTYGGYAGELGETVPELKALTKEQLQNGEAVDFLAERYKGISAEVAKTTGSAEQLSNAFGDLKEELGAPFEKALTPIRAFFTNLISGWADARRAKREYEEATEEIKAGNESVNNLNLVIEGEKKNLKTLEAKLVTEQKQLELFEKGLYFGIQSKDVLIENVNLAQEEVDAQKKTINSLQEKLNAQKEIEDNAAKAAEAAAKEAAEANRIKKAEEDRASYIKANEQLRAKQLQQLELQAKISGEEVADKEKLNVLVNSYISLISDSKGAVKESDKEARRLLSDIETLTATMPELSESAAELDSILSNIQIGDDRPLSEQMAEQLKALDELYEQVITNEALTDEKRLKLEEDYQKKRAELVKRYNEQENSERLDKAKELKTALEEIEEEKEEKSEVDKLKEQLDSLDKYYADQKDLLAESEEEKLALEEEYLEKREILEDKYREAKEKKEKEAAEEEKQALLDKMEKIVGYVSLVREAMSSWLNVFSEQIAAETDLAQAENEKQFKDGLISQEEYEKKKTEIKEEGAKKEYKVKMWEWGVSLATAIANVAEGVSKAMAQGGVGGIITGALVAAAGAAQIASITASKPIAPSFASGGIVGGNSYYGDKVPVNVNSGEMILNMQQQKALFDNINRGNGSGNNAPQIQIFNQAANVVSAKPQITADGMKLMIRQIVTKDMAEGQYNDSFRQMQSGIDGRRITN